MKMKASLKLFAVAVLSFMVAAGCSAQKTEKSVQSAAQQPAAKTVKVAAVGKVKIAEPVEQVADVLASAQVDIVSKTGADVLQLVKSRGDTVQKGELLVKLDDTDARLQRDKAALAVQSAKDALSSGKVDTANAVSKLEQTLAEATRAYNKTRNDYDRGLVDQTQLNQAQNAYTNTKNDLASLKQKSVTALELQLRSAELSLEQADRALSFCEIKSPISGIVTDLPVQAGMTVSAGFRIGQVQQLDPIKIKALLTPDSAKSIKGKQELAYHLPGDTQMHSGKVSYLSNVMDTQTNSYELDLLVDNKDLLLKPGTKVQVQLTDEAEQEVIAVPSLSIVREGTDSYVFVLSGDHVEKRKVELGRLNGIYQEILSGVQAGETIVVSGQNQLNDKDAVTVVK